METLIQWLLDFFGDLPNLVIIFRDDCAMILWFSIPWLAANMLPVILGRNGHPIHADLLGRTKTWQGLVGGIIFGSMTGIMAVIIAGYAFQNSDLVRTWGQDAWERRVHITSLAAGALLGDLIKSYIKRRRNIPSGEPWVPYDQLDALIGAFTLCWICDQFVTGGQWFSAQILFGRWAAFLALLPVYLSLHRLSSRTAHQHKLKATPY